MAKQLTPKEAANETIDGLACPWFSETFTPNEDSTRNALKEELGWGDSLNGMNDAKIEQAIDELAKLIQERIDMHNQ